MNDAPLWLFNSVRFSLSRSHRGRFTCILARIHAQNRWNLNYSRWKEWAVSTIPTAPLCWWKCVFLCVCLCLCRCCCLCQSIYIVLTSNNVCMCTFAHGVCCARCDRTGTERTWKPWIDQQYHHGRSFAHSLSLSPTVSDNIRVNTTTIMPCICLCIYCRLLASTV